MIFLVAWVMKQIDKDEAEHEAKLLVWLTANMHTRPCQHKLREMTRDEYLQLWSIGEEDERVFRCMSVCGGLISMPTHMAKKKWR